MIQIPGFLTFKIYFLSSSNRLATVFTITLSLQQMSKKISRTLDSTRFAGAPIIAVAAKPGGPDAPDTDSAAALGIDKLIEMLSQQVFVPKRSPDGAFIFSVDHCFPIRGQGTVMTGTVLTGSVAVNDVSGLGEKRGVVN